MVTRPPRKNLSKDNFDKKSKTQEEIKENIKNSNYVELEISSIVPPKYHDRRFIDKYSIVELSKTIESVGLIYPVVVRKLKDGTYERLIGFRRIEAFKILKKKKIPTIILENITDSQAMLFMVTENIQRENLSIYDETLALIDYISASLDIGSKETIKLLFRYKNFTAGRVELQNKEKKTFETIEEILEKTGKININGMTNRLTIFNVHPMLKASLSEGNLSFTNAQILNKITNEETLELAIAQVVLDRYSKRETISYVAELLKPLKPKESKVSDLKLVSKIKINKLDKNAQKNIEVLLSEILKIANNSTKG